MGSFQRITALGLVSLSSVVQGLGHGIAQG